jgi:hypothetical protein
VCHELGVHDWVFTTVLKRALDHAIEHRGYDLHVDAGRGDRLPSSEEPFMYHDKPYYLVTLVKRSAL